MSKVVTFSRKFPHYHINKGEETLFVEKVLNGLGVDYKLLSYYQKLLDLNEGQIIKGKLSYKDLEDFWKRLKPTEETKHHTIRAGFSKKRGELISPRVWSEKPYHTPQITIWDDLEIKTTQEFSQNKKGDWVVDNIHLSTLERIELGIGDGLRYADILSWFNKPINGQIISWSDGCVYGMNQN